MRVQPFLLMFLISTAVCIIISCSSKKPGVTEQEVEAVLHQVKDYRVMQDRSWTDTLHSQMERGYQSESLEEIESAFVRFLDSDASVDAKKHIIYLLGPIATSHSSESLLTLISDDRFFDASLHSLSYIQDGDIDQELLQKLSGVNQSQSIAIVNVLGHRANSEVVKELSDYIGKDEKTDPYVYAAIGNIPSRTSAEILAKCMNDLEGSEKWEVADHLIQVSNELVQRDVDVSSYFEQIFHLNAPPQIIYGALRGFVLTGKDPLDHMFEVFKTQDDDLIDGLIPLIRILNQPPPISFFESSAKVLSDENKGKLLIAMADRGVLEIRKLAVETASGSNDIDREAGLKALFKVGDESDILLLAELASDLKGSEKLLAQKCLYGLPGDAVDKRILSEATKAEGGVKEELILSIGKRNIAEADKLLLGMLADEDLKIRIASIRALGMIGKPQIISELIGRSGSLNTSAEKSQLIRALTLLTTEIPEEETREDDIAIALLRTSVSGRRAMLIEVLGNIANEDAYETILPLMQAEDPVVQASAIKALSYWPTDLPLEDLINFFVSSAGNEMNVLVLSGIERLISQSTDLTADARANRLTEILKVCKTNNERKIVLSGLGKTGSLITFEAAIDLISSRELISEAEAAILQNINNMEAVDITVQVEQYLKSARKRSSNDDFKNEIDDWLSKVSLQ